MSNEITQWHIESYSENVYTLSQQKESRLRSRVRVDTVQGKSKYVDRIGQVASQKRTTRHADTPQIDTPHSRRRLDLVTYDWADIIDEPDKVRTLNDPTNDYVMAGAHEMGRNMDSEVVAATVGTAYAGEKGATSVSLPTSQKVAVASSGLTIAKLRAARKILNANEVDKMDRTVAYSAEQEDDLLGTTEVTSSDFNTVKALVQGEIDTFLGCKFIQLELLGTDANGDRQVVMFQKKAVMLGIGSEPRARVGERSDKNYSTQVFYSMDIGATRLEEEAVVEIACAE